MKGRRGLYVALCIAACCVVLAPFFLGAGAAHPATDDFTFATYTHKTWLETGSVLHVIKDAVSYALRTWRDWQGTFTGIVVMALNPAVFDLAHYGVHAAVLLALDIAAVLVFLSHFLRRAELPGRALPAVSAALLVIQLCFLPDIVEGIYWFNGAWFYTGANAAALLLLTGADVFAAGRTGEKGGRRPLAFAALAAAFFALGMDNYITAMMALSALAMMALQRLWASRADAGQRGACIRTALFLLPLGIGLLLSVIAPGNKVRMATDGAHESGAGWLFASLLWTARDAAKYVARFSLKTPLLALLLLLTPPLCRGWTRRGKNPALPPVPLTLLGFYAVLCAMIVPHMYSSGYAGSGRVVNMYHDYVVLSLPVVWLMVTGRLREEQRAALAGKKAGRLCAAAALAALLVCAAGGQWKNYVRLAGDQMDGTQQRYVQQFRREYALCEEAGEEDDVLLPAWTVRTLTGKPTAYADPAVWTNVSMADYFGVRSVRAEKDAP